MNALRLEDFAQQPAEAAARIQSREIPPLSIGTMGNINSRCDWNALGCTGGTEATRADKNLNEEVSP